MYRLPHLRRIASLRPAFLGLACFLLTTVLLAQTPTASVTGAVVDATGATVPAATVRVISVETNVVSQTTTSAAGTFTVINLLPGKYTLTVEKEGFKKVALPAFQLDVNQTLTEKITDTVTQATFTT